LRMKLVAGKQEYEHTDYCEGQLAHVRWTFPNWDLTLGLWLVTG